MREGLPGCLAPAFHSSPPVPLLPYGTKRSPVWYASLRGSPGKPVEHTEGKKITYERSEKGTFSVKQ